MIDAELFLLFYIRNLRFHTTPTRNAIFIVWCELWILDQINNLFENSLLLINML